MIETRNLLWKLNSILPFSFLNNKKNYIKKTLNKAYLIFHKEANTIKRSTEYASRS